MAPSMFQNARNIHITGRPTFQQFNGPYHYHDNTSNTTNNNTTNITGNDFSQTINHNHAYTIEGSMNRTKNPRTASVPTGPGLGDPRVMRTQTEPTLASPQQIHLRGDTLALLSQSLPIYNTEYHSSGYSASPVNGFENVVLTHQSGSFRPDHIVAMPPEMSAEMAGFFGELRQENLRDNEDEGEAEYQDMPSTSPVSTQPAPTEDAQSRPSQSNQNPPDGSLYQDPTVQARSQAYRYSPYDASSSGTARRQERAQPTPNPSPILLKVQRTLQAALAFNSKLGGQSNAPTFTSETSTDIDFNAATATTSPPPFEYQSNGVHEIRLATYTGSVTESLDTVNTATHYDAVVSDVVPDGCQWDEEEYGENLCEEDWASAATG